jgi:hypothetical protein
MANDDDSDKIDDNDHKDEDDNDKEDEDDEDDDSNDDVEPKRKAAGNKSRVSAYSTRSRTALRWSKRAGP